MTEDTAALVRGFVRDVLDGPVRSHATRFGLGPDGRVPHGRHHDYIVSLAATLAGRGLFGQLLYPVCRVVCELFLDDVETHDREIREAVRSAGRKFGPTREEIEDAVERVAVGATDEQDWHEDALLELARTLHVDPSGLSKAEVHARVRAALGTARVEEVIFPDGSHEMIAAGEVVYSVKTAEGREKRARGEKAHRLRMEIAHEVYRLRATLYKAPGFIPLTDSRLARDGRGCGVPVAWAPAVDPETWRTDRKAIAWNLAQRMGEAAYWFSWPVLRHLYVCERVRDEPIRSWTNLYIARDVAVASLRAFAEDVSTYLERVGADGFVQLFSGPDRDVVVVLSDLPPDRFFRDPSRPCRGSALGWRRSGLAVRPAADTRDARRMMTEIIGRTLAHFPVGGDAGYWVRVAVAFKDSRVHFVRPRGEALEERVHRQVHDLGADDCPGGFAHQENPKPILRPGRYVRLVRGVDALAQFGAIQDLRLRELLRRVEPISPVPVDRGPPRR